MKTMSRWGMIALAGLLFSAASSTEAQAQWSNVYPGREPQYGNYARTLYPNAGRPSRRTNYAAFRPYVGDACGGEYIVTPTYALPGLAPSQAQPTSAYYRNPPGVNTIPSPYGYDYHLNYPAAWYNGYWGW